MLHFADKDKDFFAGMMQNTQKITIFATKINKMTMQIGDKVRFLNEVGGGIITGFQGKDIVYVEDQDGFDIPMLRSQIVVIETNQNNFEIKKPKEAPQPRVRYLEDGVDDDPSMRPTTYQPKPQERRGGDRLNICLAFVPEDSRELTNTRFEAYLVNDSNYFLSVVFANNEGAAWHARWQATMEPNTKLLIETFDRSALNDLERLCVQAIAWKQDKPYMLKPVISVELRLDLVKFYKLHVFQSSPFFREPALVYDIVRDDRPIKQVFVEAEEVMEALRDVEETPETPTPEMTETPAKEKAPAASVKSASSSQKEVPDYIEKLESLKNVAPVIPQRTREEEREALKAAKRALKAEQQALRAKELALQAEQQRQAQEMRKNLLEVDLHIEALLDHTEGLSPSVLLNTQLTELRIIMDRNVKKKGQRIVFIYGKDNEVLREALIKEITHRYRTCTYEDDPSHKGSILVTIG